MTHPLRFGHQLRPAGDIDDLIAEAQAAESAGFDIVTVPDHIDATLWSPLPLLAAIARETTTIRLGTFVLNNEMRNPVQLAWEASAIDRLSGGRFELGIGAGHTPHEFDATGIPFRPPAVRKARLAEAVEILRSLLDGEACTRKGDHYDITAAAIEVPAQTRLPILVGGNGEALLSHAGTHADIVGLNGLHRTLADGHRHSVKFSLDHLDRQIEQVHKGASGRDAAPELNALVQRIVVADDRERAIAEALAENPVEGLTVDEAIATPYLAYGTHDEIADQFRAARDRWGLSYFVTRNIEAMTPVIASLTATG